MQITALSLLTTGTHAATVLLTNNAGVSGGEFNTTVWAVDTTTGSSQMIAETWNRPAGTGVVCNDVYYTTWSRFGLHALDLASGESSDLATSTMFRVLACDPEDESKLLGIAADYSLNETIFRLKSYDLATQTEAVVGTFPPEEATSIRYPGSDDIFSFTNDGSEVWLASPTGDECFWCPDAKRGGHVHIMDTSSGEIKTTADIAFSGKLGTPYFLLPDAKRGVFITDQSSSEEMEWADLDVTDGRIKAKIGNTDASGLWHAGAPSQMCGSNLLAFSNVSALNEISPADGVVINAVNLFAALGIDESRDHSSFVALACLKPSTVDPALV